MRVAIAVAVVLASVSSAHGQAPFDGSVPMRCTIQTVMTGRSPEVCVRGSASCGHRCQCDPWLASHSFAASTACCVWGDSTPPR
jgi:hypothetical protein